MARRGGVKRPREEGMARPVVFPSSSSGGSSDEEANRDLSLEIVERARRRREEGSGMPKRALEAPKRRAPFLADLSSSDEVDGAAERGKGEMAPAVEASSKKKRRKKKREKQQLQEADEKEGVVRGGAETADRIIVKEDEERIETTDSAITEVNDDASDNVVLRKLLRGPRYFEPGSIQLVSCYNCGDEGHTTADCTAEKRRKPCFVCSMFGHNAHKCTRGQGCVICKRRGHRAKDCPDKCQNTSGDPRICLRCGDLGHDMSSCRNDYPPDDVKKVQCYVCKSYGHFSCVNFIDTLQREVFCYNCGVSGHSGIGCAKPRGQSIGTVLPTLCYVCGEEGHFARGCTKKSKFNQRPRESLDLQPSEPSTPSQPSMGKKDIMGSKSLPHLGKGYKKKSIQSESRSSMTARKSKVKGGWAVDEPGDLPRTIQDVKSLKSPRTPKARGEMSYNSYTSAGKSKIKVAGWLITPVTYLKEFKKSSL